MTNNDVLRRIRYILELGDSKVIKIFALADVEVSRTEISNWLKKDEDPEFVNLSDKRLAVFLNGLINLKRGKREGAQPTPENKLSNNMIFRKLKIAFDLKAEEVLSILNLADFRLSNHELSAFFRKVDHKHYRECKDQILRNFLQGLQAKYRDTDKDE